MQDAYVDNSWAPRPPAEMIYTSLEEFFTDHDLDQPIVESELSDLSRSHDSSKADVSALMREQGTKKLWGSKLEAILGEQSASDSSASAKPSTFKWVRGELIGKGSYARVYLALNATTGEMMAVKQVECMTERDGESNSRQTAAIQALEMEKQILKDLEHPNIIQYLGFEDRNETLSVFLEYVPGGSLGRYLRTYDKLEGGVTKSFTTQVLLGLEYLHSVGVIHWDLKADSILLETSGVCKISDFGKAQLEIYPKANVPFHLPVMWMAPEVADGHMERCSSKIDIWSLGWIFLEMHGGSHKVLWDIMRETYNNTQLPPIPEGVTLLPLADDFRQRCVAFHPNDRASATELKQHPYLQLPPGWVFAGF